MTAMTNDTHPPNTPTTQGERLKQLRKSLGLSAQALADKLNAHGASVSRGAIANWECDKNGITSSKIPIVAQVLGTTENYLLTGNISTNPTVNNASQEIDLQDNLPNSHNHSHKVSLMKPLKNLPNFPTSAMTFVANFCKPPTAWKLKVSVSSSSILAILNRLDCCP